MFLLSVSKVRWRNALCFITKPQHLVPKTRELGPLEAVYSDLMVEESTGGGAEGGERQGHENGRTPRGERNCSGPPNPAGHPPGG